MRSTLDHLTILCGMGNPLTGFDPLSPALILLWRATFPAGTLSFWFIFFGRTVQPTTSDLIIFWDRLGLSQRETNLRPIALLMV